MIFLSGCPHTTRCILAGLIFIVVGAWIPCQAQVSADFSADVTEGCAPAVTVAFTAASTAATSWDWDFGNGNSSTLQNPSAIYTTPGTYKVTLTVSDGVNSDTEEKNNYITVYAAPSADFNFNKTEGCAPLSVQFHDASSTSSGNIVAWNWVFGDGGQSGVQHPSYIYENAGAKTVVLKVTDEHGCSNTKVSASAIDVQGPNAAFTTTPGTTFCQVPAEVTFQNTTSGAVSYQWDFGDETTGNEVSPTHTYVTAGTYQATLEAKDAAGCTSAESVTILAGSEGGLSITPSATRICLNKPVSFSVNADAGIVTADWDFGNNTTSSVTNPGTIQYTQPGTYTVSLTAQLQGKTCASMALTTIEVVADATPAFTQSVDCDNKVTFTSQSVNATNVRWQLGTVGYTTTASSFTYTYPSAGTYQVTLTAYNELGCSQTLTKSVPVTGKPTAAFSPTREQDCILPSLSGCAPFTITFENQSTTGTTALWTFGDGVTSASANPTHTYAAGTFTVTLKVTNGNGCTAEKSATVNVSDVTPNAKFSIDKTTVCAGEQVTFTDESTNATYWCWDFGDGGTGVGSTVKHQYHEPGVYTVTLTAKNAGCTDVFQIEHAVEVLDPYVDYDIDKNCIDPYTIQLTNNSSGYQSIEWDFGDGTNTSSEVTSHQYTATGNYIIQLTLSNTTSHCTVTMSRSITIWDVEADFSLDLTRPCIGAPVTFTDASVSAVAWEWYVDNVLFSSKQEPPSTSFDTPGVHTVKLFAYDGDGCADTKELSVDVLNIQGDFSFTATSDCDNFVVSFTNESISDPEPLAYSWDFGDATAASTEVSPSHTYQALGEYAVTLTITNAEGTCSYRDQDAVVFTNPSPEFISSKTGYCLGDLVQFYNQSIDADTYVWDFGNEQQATVKHGSTTYHEIGTYTVSLAATDQYGCEQVITKDDFISITQPTADFNAYDTYSDCPPLTSVFEDASVGEVTGWQWDFGNGTTSTISSPACTYLRPGEFDVTMVVTDVNGCRDTLTQEQIIHVGGPDGNFQQVGTLNSCTSDTVAFIADVTNTAVLRWDFGDGLVENITQTETSHPYETAGAYSVTLVLIDAQGCEVVALGDVQLNIYDSTVVAFTSSSCIFKEESFTLTAESESLEESYTWFIEDVAIGTGRTIVSVLDEPGSYAVTLAVENEYGCLSHMSDTLTVHGDVTFVPNVITPNDDARNDVFEISGLEMSEWNLDIYNRWGTRVYHKNRYQNTWGGSDLRVGVYFYQLINAACPAHAHKGAVSILR